MQDFSQKLEALLKTDARFLDADGALLKSEVTDKAYRADRGLIKKQKRQHLNRSLNYSMAFELAMRSFFGDYAFSTAIHAEGDNAVAKKWLLKAVKKMMRDVDGIDITVEHKENIMRSLEFLEGDIRNWDSSEKIIFDLFRLCSDFLGYDFSSRAIRPYTPTYWQTPDGYFSALLLQKRGGVADRKYRCDKDNAVAVRRKLVHELKQGDIRISRLRLS